MNLTEKLLKEFNGLSEDRKMEVLEFVESLKVKDKKELGKLMNSIIEENQVALAELSQ